jgi:hypothetical protein
MAMNAPEFGRPGRRPDEIGRLRQRAVRYDELLKRLLNGLGISRQTAPGVLFHWSTVTDVG